MTMESETFVHKFNDWVGTLDAAEQATAVALLTAAAQASATGDVHGYRFAWRDEQDAVQGYLSPQPLPPERQDLPSLGGGFSMPTFLNFHVIRVR